MNYKDPSIIALRKSNYDFDKLCRDHETIEGQIETISGGVGNSADEELKVHELKKKKLVLKEKIEGYLSK